MLARELKIGDTFVAEDGKVRRVKYIAVAVNAHDYTIVQDEQGFPRVYAADEEVSVATTEVDVHSNTDDYDFEHERVTITRSEVWKGNVLVNTHNPPMGFVSVDAEELIEAIRKVTSNASS